MDFNLSDEQTMLRDTLRRYLSDTYGFEARQNIVAGGAGWNPAVWRAFAEDLGILGAPFAEAHGGLGGGPVENMLVMEEMGRALVLEPYLSAVVIGGGALKAAGGPLADALIPGIIAGEVIIALAAAEPQGRWNWHDLTTMARADGAGWRLSGHKAVVADAGFATHYLVSARTGGGQRERAGVSVFLIPVDLPGLSRRDYARVDGGAASELYLENVNVGPEHLLGVADAGLPLLERVIDEATAAVCAEACGLLRVMQATTLDYAKQRKQFGRAIGDFQVLQHRIVDMFLEVEQAVSITLMATLKLETPQAAAAVSMAKAKLGRAARFVGQSAIQIHGGIGISDELAVGHYFKRATLTETLFGSVDHHMDRYERLTMDA
jgi:alkylation response protein AidB-like acyl-CoA dehydrogenase